MLAMISEVANEVCSQATNNSGMLLIASIAVCVKIGMPISRRIRFKTKPVAMLAVIRSRLIFQKEVPVLACIASTGRPCAIWHINARMVNSLNVRDIEVIMASGA